TLFKSTTLSKSLVTVLSSLVSAIISNKNCSSVTADSFK
ncbi:hypothetical protein NT05LM_0818a, partial [Listeria marthii FSL S4-120]